MRVVIVEDEVKIREGMAKLISAHTAHQVVGEARDGQDGMEQVMRLRPDLVITDICMPVMDGLEMIERLHDKEIKPYVVILSGYSEFDYAKRAIRFGVEDYLLKPLAPEDIQELLNRIEQKIRQEEKKKSSMPEQYLKELLYGGVIPDGERRIAFEEAYDIRKGADCQIYLAYTGDIGLKSEEELSEKLTQLQKQETAVSIHIFRNRIERQVGILASERSEEENALQNFQKTFQRKVITPFKVRQERPVWVTKRVADYAQLSLAVPKLKEMMQESLGLTEGELITPELLQQTKWERVVFPSELGNAMKNALCREQIAELPVHAAAFTKYIRAGIYQEQAIKQSYLKILYILIDTMKEIDENIYEKLLNDNILSACTEAMTLHELEQNLKRCMELVMSPERKREDISNYTIKRAINYIREHYQEGITLEEVSGKLDITPEYLSTLFNREMKINFSTFLRRFRMSHAKRLLKGSDRKVYEIAELVGYSDAKYFARVFKEEIGVSPGDYRQL